MATVGLGTKLRRLLALLDGDVLQLYIDGGTTFRPKYYPVVQALLEHQELDVASLAATAQVTQPAMTQTLHAMEQVGFVLLTPGRDRRQKLVSLSPDGKAVADRLAPLWSAVDRAASSLEQELSVRLDGVLDEALGALERRSFKMRIKEKME
jgi:DNA-binding MarR family transcriptional regulator